MALLIGITALTLSPFVFIAMDRSNLRVGLMWFIALVSAAVFWFYYLQQLWHLPQVVDWPAWGADLAPAALKAGWFRLDEISWPLGFALTSLGLATLLTVFVGPAGLDWRILGLNLSTQGFGLFGVLAGGLPILGFSWVGFDLMELVVLLRWFRGRKKNRQALRAFSIRTLGSLTLLLPLGFAGLDPFVDGGAAGVLLVAAAAIRIAATPYQGEMMNVASDRRGVFNLMRMAPVASGLSLALHLGPPDFPLAPIWLVIGFFMVYAAIGWVTAENALAGRQYWIISLAGLSITAALLGQTAAAVSWAIALILGGSLLFSARLRRGAVRWTYPIAALAMAGLPYTPSWVASLLFTSGSLVLDLALIFITAVMLAGFYQHGRNSQPPSETAVSGIRLLSLLGVLLIFAALIFAGWTPLFRERAFAGGWWQGFVVLGLWGIFFYGAGRGLRVEKHVLMRVRTVLSPRWVYRLFRRGYRLSSTAVDIVSKALEGEAAVLWALLLLGLVVSAFSGAGF